MDKMLTRCYCISDFEKQASEKLAKVTRDYINGGSGSAETLHDNVIAFSRYKLRPRYMRNVSTIDMKQRVLGCDVEFPIIVAPMACQKFAHVDGDAATARACAGVGTAFSFSFTAATTLDDLMANSPTGLKWLQLNLTVDREEIAYIVNQAERYGFRAILVTIDLKAHSNRIDNKRNGFKHPVPRQSSKNRTQSRTVHYESLTWEGIDWLKSITKLPIAVKGVLTREDAIEAVQHGVDGIVVSNHGGRGLDNVQASIDALSEVVEAVKQSGVDVLLDGGVRKGTDVITALALGAKAVMVGRPAIWGLALDGENGVKSALNILKDDLRTSMELSGCPSLADINQTLVKSPIVTSKL